MSNKKLSIKILSELRRKAVEAVLKEGIAKSEAAKLFGFSKTSMIKYVKEYNLYGEESFNYKKRGVKENQRSLLSVEQRELLFKTLLEKTPDEVGLEATLWNSKVIC